MSDIDITVIGGGPAGLAAAHEAIRQGASVVVLERLDQLGGLARTLEFAGSRFDIGPHRFFTKNVEVRDLFTEMLGPDLIQVPRKTRILHDGVYFDYPLTPVNAMFGIGFRSGLAIAGSYASARIGGALGRRRPIESFEDWIIDRFGQRLYETFFKTYTEKVWGISCRRIGAGWAAQRIRGLSLGSAIRNALFESNGGRIRTLVDTFMYPRRGAGQTYEKMAAVVRRRGGDVITRARVQCLRRDGMRMREALVEDGTGGGSFGVTARYFLVSAPLTDMIEMIEPAAPPEVLRACRALRYRDHIGVNLVVEGSPFADNWIYVHSKGVALARVANYRNFSPDMAGRQGISPLTVEYFAFPYDDLALLPDDLLIRRAKDELHRTGIVEHDRIIAGFVTRSPRSYPVIEIGYERHVETIKAWLDRFENLLPIGRSGMFKYNNQDHAMATGLLAARTALEINRYDPWKVNIEAEYQEDEA